MMRKYMKTILTGIVAIIALVCGVLIVVLLGPGELNSKILGILTGMVGPTVASLVALLNGEQQKEKVHEVEQRAERIDRVVNNTDEHPPQNQNNQKDSTKTKDA